MNHLQGHPPVQDEDLIRLIRNGGPPGEQAIQQLYQQYSKGVRISFAKLLSKYGEDEARAGDLLHDAFLVLLRKIEYEALQVHSLSAYWKGIGRHLLLNDLKKEERLLFAHEEEEAYGLNEETPESRYLQQEEQEKWILTFNTLGPRCREILLLWVARYSMVEIAQKMGLSGDAMARKIKYDCFKKLKELVRSGHKMPG